MELIKITTRVPRALKRKLIAEAKRKGISLQEHINNKLVCNSQSEATTG